MVERAMLLVTLSRSRDLGPNDYRTRKHVDDNSSRTMLCVLQRACAALG